MIRFFHTADIHFGVENYGRVDPQTGIHTRLLDFKESLSACVDQAIAEKIDFFLFAGDAYKTAYPTPTQQKLLMEVLFRLYKAGIPVVIVVGNHDHPLSFGKTNALEVFGNLPLDGFYVFSKPDILRLQTANGIVQIVGMPWPMRHNLVAKDEYHLATGEDITIYLSSKVGQIIQHFAQQLDPSLPAVFVGHLTVSTGIFSGSEKCAVFGTDPVLLPSQLAIEPFDYIALGHLHRHQDLNKGGYPPVVYAGSTERVDFGERKESKGFCKVTLHNEYNRTPFEERMKRCSYEFITLPTRPMIQIEVYLTPELDQTAQIIEHIRQHDIANAIIKIIYHVPADAKETVDTNAVQKACSAAHYIAGIIPMHTPPEREQRTALPMNVSFEQLLTTYFKTKGLPAHEQDELRQRTLLLYDEVMHIETHDEEKTV